MKKMLYEINENNVLFDCTLIRKPNGEEIIDQKLTQFVKFIPRYKADPEEFKKVFAVLKDILVRAYNYFWSIEYNFNDSKDVIEIYMSVPMLLSICQDVLDMGKYGENAIFCRKKDIVYMVTFPTYKVEEL